MEPTFTTIEELNAWLEAKGEQPFAFDPETDGELTCSTLENGDLLVECSASGRFRKYPTA